jgi:hypothetical protein
MLAEFGQFAVRATAAIGGHRFGERTVDPEQIDILEWRRLVEDLVGRE